MSGEDRATAFLEDLARWPDALATLANLYGGDDTPLGNLSVDRLASVRRVVMSGLGSSRFAALAVAPLWHGSGYLPSVEHASTQTPAHPGPDVLFLAISSSGRTSEVLAAAERHRNTSLVVTVTAERGGPLDDVADVVLPLGVERETSGVASTTFAATVAVLLMLGSRIAGVGDEPAGMARRIAAAADASRRVLELRLTWLPPALAVLDDAEAVHVLSDAASLGAAEQGALMFREAPRLAADATDAGDWLHVGIYVALPGYRAVLHGGTRYDDEIVTMINGRGGKVVVVGAEPDGAAATVRLPAAAVDPVVRLLVEPLVDALLAAELWAAID